MNPPLTLVPKSMYPCKRCHRTPQINNTCHVCLRTLLDETRALLAETHANNLRHRVPDVIHTNVGIRFDWRDRLKLLFHGEASLSVRVETEFAPGRLASTSEVRVRPLIVRKPAPMALVDRKDGAK